MASEAQIRANRANALRSTGPRTARGKARSAMNGLQHGLRSHLPLPETPELHAYRAAFLDEWRPRTPHARMLVEMLAVRAARLMYVDRLLELALRHPDPKVVACRAFTLSRHYAEAANNSVKAVILLEELHENDHDVHFFHDRTQFPNKFNKNATQIRPKCRVFSSPRRSSANQNAANPRLRPLKPHFPAHRCRAGPARSP